MYVQVIQTKERDVTLTQTLLQQNMMFKRAILLFLTQAVIQALTFSTVEDYTNPIVIVLVKILIIVFSVFISTNQR